MSQQRRKILESSTQTCGNGHAEKMNDRQGIGSMIGVTRITENLKAL